MGRKWGDDSRAYQSAVTRRDSCSFSSPALDLSHPKQQSFINICFRRVPALCWAPEGQRGVSTSKWWGVRCLRIKVSWTNHQNAVGWGDSQGSREHPWTIHFAWGWERGHGWSHTEEVTWELGFKGCGRFHQEGAVGNSISGRGEQHVQRYRDMSNLVYSGKSIVG